MLRACLRGLTAARPAATPRCRALSSAAASDGPRQCLVVGGCGALGKAVVSQFVGAGWGCTSVDLRTKNAENTEATTNVLLEPDCGFGYHASDALSALQHGARQFDVVVHAAGGWAGSDPGDNAFPASLEFLLDVNVKSAALAAHLAGALLAPGGMLTLTGAAAARGGEGTAGMAAYGMSKAATHHLMATMAQTLQPSGATVNTLLPVTIDTPANRAAMPDTDTSSWTDPAHIGAKILSWAEGSSTPPVSGGFVEIATEDGATTFSYEEAGGGELGFSPPVLHHLNFVSRIPSELHEFYRNVLALDDMGPPATVRPPPP